MCYCLYCMKIKQFGLCKQYMDYVHDVSGGKFEGKYLWVFLGWPMIFCTILTCVVCSAFLHLTSVSVIGFILMSFVLSFVLTIVSAIASESCFNDIDFEHFIFPACLSNWLPLVIIDTVFLPFIVIANLFRQEQYVTLERLLTGDFKRGNVEPYVIRNPDSIRPKSPFNAELLLDNATEIVCDQIGRPLNDGKERVKIEKSVIKGDTAYVYFSVSHVECIGQQDIVQVGYFFVTLTIDTDIGFVGVKHLFFDSSYEQRNSGARLSTFAQYIDGVSNTLGLDFKPIRDGLLEEMHDLSHRGGKSSSPSARSVAE